MEAPTERLQRHHWRARLVAPITLVILSLSNWAPTSVPESIRWEKSYSFLCNSIYQLYLAQVPLIEPLVCKRISQERLTSLHFLDDCFVTACQDGIISTWARPGRVVSWKLSRSLIKIEAMPFFHLQSGTYSVNVMCPGSPPSVASATTGVTGSSSSAGSGGGTIVWWNQCQISWKSIHQPGHSRHFPPFSQLQSFIYSSSPPPSPRHESIMFR